VSFTLLALGEYKWEMGRIISGDESEVYRYKIQLDNVKKL